MGNKILEYINQAQGYGEDQKMKVNYLKLMFSLREQSQVSDQVRDQWWVSKQR